MSIAVNRISAEIVADSLSPQGNRITSLLLTLPRIILAELNTHRGLSKNTASSRATPFNKMVETVKNSPFIPLAWQKDHKGMQGTEYWTTETIQINDEPGGTLVTDWLEHSWIEARDTAIAQATELSKVGVTKQLANRLLEPFQYVTVLITGTDDAWDNFFNLRCPRYELSEGTKAGYEREYTYSRKNWRAYEQYNFIEDPERSLLEWLKINKGEAEVHFMLLAEKIWDAMNENKPKQLQPGEWHIPFEDKMTLPPTIPIEEGYTLEEGVIIRKIKISTGMGARTSYTVVGDEKEAKYSTMINIYDKILNADPFHASPFEHPARAMSDEEYYGSLKGDGFRTQEEDSRRLIHEHPLKHDDPRFGWCRNYRGFRQLRDIIETEKQNMTRREELAKLIPASKYKIHEGSRLDRFQIGLYNLKEVKELEEEIKYLVALMEEYDKIKGF